MKMNKEIFIFNWDTSELIVLADDYDSYTLKYPLSIKLNTLFWKQGKRFTSFIKLFEKLSKLEKRVFVLYTYRYSYEEITDKINQKNKLNGKKRGVTKIIVQ